MILFSPAGKQTIRKCIWTSLCAQQKQNRISISLAHQDRGEVRILWKEKYKRAQRDVSQAPQTLFSFFPDHVSIKAAGLDKALWFKMLKLIFRLKVI